MYEANNSNDPELMSEILHLTKVIRKHKIFHMLKMVVAQERHEKELNR